MAEVMDNGFEEHSWVTAKRAARESEQTGLDARATRAERSPSNCRTWRNVPR